MEFTDFLHDNRPHVFDGAMGTMLYSKGVFINRCYDELNVKEPDLIRDVHRAYIRAGAELIETNSFGANRIKLAEHGLEGQVHEINARAAALAKEVAGGRALVGGAIGPLGIRIEPYGPTSVDEARAIFREQAAALAEGGADFFVLETFGDLVEIQQALLAVREVSDLPVVAQMTVQEDGGTVYGTTPELLTKRLDAWGADVIGLNCSVGPHGMLAGIEHMASLTARPLSAQPNAGLPREIHGRKMYMASPEYMAKFSGRLIRAGAKFVGGCCGTTPDHIKRIADAVHAISPRQIIVSSAATEPEAPDVTVTPLAERSNWGRKIATGELVTTVEIVPPKGITPDRMLAGVRLLKAAGVDAVNVPDGPRAQMRMGVLPTATLVEQIVGVETVVHYCCRDRNLLGMLSDLLGAHALGLRNMLLITGDPPKMGPYPEATAVFDIDSIGLTNLVSRLNRGLDPGGNPIGEPTSFTIGVGVNPGAQDIEHELSRFYWKVEAGAEYAITQPVFDPEQLVTFVEELKKRGIWIPIVAGIWPLVSARNAEFMANEVPGVVVPPEVVRRMHAANEKSREHALQEGITIAREMFEAVRSHVQGLQVSAPFGRVQFALQVFDGIPGIRTDLTEEGALSADTFGFPPPKRRTAGGADSAHGPDGLDGRDGPDGPDVLPVIPAAG
ncbi:MAG TPA: bifunctional homocysteine S-methyltransferase/methylenetetrahydrofolate reductase [Longimicrobiales bacterium]|nr:bifunctional homocysteine S-methyltransferase/methylenetetrahydrofolate reductase [Longimicrobiales bacterium]